MKEALRVVTLFIVVAIVAAAACFVSVRVFRPMRPSAVNGHEWIHKQLSLTPAEHNILEPIEARFAERKGRLMSEIREANKELAESIRQDQADSPRVSAAVARIHHAQGALQEATLAHVFEMKGVLTREQYQKLLNLTADELNRASGGE